MEVVSVAGVPRAVWVSYPSFQAQRARRLEQPNPFKNEPLSLVVWCLRLSQWSCSGRQSPGGETEEGEVKMSLL